MEQWKSIPGYEGFYEASSEGRIRSVPHIVSCYGKGGTKMADGRILKPYDSTPGYLIVTLSRDGEKTKRQVHRLIAMTFLGGDHPELQVNHKNLNKHDNRVSNLEWATQSENIKHAYKEGAMPRDVWRKKMRCVETGQIFDSSYNAAEWVNENYKQYSGNVKNMSTNIRKASATGWKMYGFHWEHVGEQSSTTIPKGSTPKRVEMGSPSL